MISGLADLISSEEKRSGIKDPKNPLYTAIAQDARVRKANCERSLEALKATLGIEQYDLENMVGKERAAIRQARRKENKR
jgi:hypothetical protein